LDYLIEQTDILFANEAIEDDASTILNEMLLGKKRFLLLNDSFILLPQLTVGGVHSRSC
jgi:hypothetical protein